MGRVTQRRKVHKFVLDGSAQALEHPVRLVRREGFVERARSMRRQIIQHHANKIGTWVVDIGSRMQYAKSAAVQ